MNIVASAREALMSGVPSIEISLNWEKNESSNSDFKEVVEVCLPLIYVAIQDTKKDLFPKGCLLKVSCKDLHVKRIIGSGSFGEVKEIIWMGKNFSMRHMFTNVEIFLHEVSAMSKLLHPNLLQALSSFVDKDRSECCLVTELMHKDLRSFINEWMQS